MKAHVQESYGLSVLHLAEVETPTPGPGDALVKVRAAGVDPGVWHLSTGRPYLVRIMGFGFRGPKVQIRADIAGTVEAVGAEVTRFTPGDEVLGTCEAGFAEYVCAAEDTFLAKPAELTFEQAAAVPVSSVTALQALRAAKVQAGQKVLVIGAAGGVGTYAVQLAANVYGAEVTGVCSTSKMDLVRSLGAAQVIDYTREDFTETRPRAYDLIIETAGLRPVLRIRRALTERGTYILVGGEGGGAVLGGVVNTLRALLLNPFVGQKLTGIIASDNVEDTRTVLDHVAAGKVVPVIDTAYPFDRLQDAIDHLAQGRARGKVVLSV